MHPSTRIFRAITSALSMLIGWRCQCGRRYWRGRKEWDGRRYVERCGRCKIHNK